MLLSNFFKKVRWLHVGSGQPPALAWHRTWAYAKFHIGYLNLFDFPNLNL